MSTVLWRRSPSVEPIQPGPSWWTLLQKAADARCNDEFYPSTRSSSRRQQKNSVKLVSVCETCLSLYVIRKVNGTFIFLANLISNEFQCQIRVICHRIKYLEPQIIFWKNNFECVYFLIQFILYISEVFNKLTIKSRVDNLISWLYIKFQLFLNKERFGRTNFNWNFGVWWILLF